MLTTFKDLPYPGSEVDTHIKTAVSLFIFCPKLKTEPGGCGGFSLVVGGHMMVGDLTGSGVEQDGGGFP